MEITAVVKRVEPTKVVGNNGFEMRNVIITTDEQYPQTVSIQFVQSKVNLLDDVAPGDKVKIQYELRGREVTKEGAEPQVYNTIQGWKIEKL
jgi:translation initiation factor IF-3